MRKTAGEILADLEIRVATLELEHRIAELENLLSEDIDEGEDITAEEILAIKHLKPSHARAISKGVRKSWKGNQTSRVRSMNKSRSKPNPNRAKDRRQRKKYKKH